MEFNELPSILTTQDIMEFLNISRPTTYKMMDQEGFPLIRIGTARRVLRDRFLDWLDEQAS